MKPLPGAIVFILAFVGLAAADPVPLKDSVPHITTVGRAEAEVVPDEADLHVGVSAEKPDAQAAAKAVADTAASVVAEAKARGIDAKDIRTETTLNGQYDNIFEANGRFKTRRLRGYTASEQIEVHLRDPAKAGPLARVLLDKGANEFRGIAFRYSKEKDMRRRLAVDAMRNATADAKAYVDAASLKLGRVLQIGADDPRVDAEPSSRPEVPPIAATPIPTEPGHITLRETVTVVWEIEEKAP